MTSDHTLKLKIYLTRSLICFTGMMLFLGALCGGIAFYQGQEVIFFIISSVLGSLSYALPFAIYLTIGLMISDEWMTAQLVMSRLIFAVLLKFLLIIALIAAFMLIFDPNRASFFISFFVTSAVHQFLTLRLSSVD